MDGGCENPETCAEAETEFERMGDEAEEAYERMQARDIDAAIERDRLRSAGCDRRDEE